MCLRRSSCASLGNWLPLIFLSTAIGKSDDRNMCLQSITWNSPLAWQLGCSEDLLGTQIEMWRYVEVAMSQKDQTPQNGWINAKKLAFVDPKMDGFDTKHKPFGGFTSTQARGEFCDLQQVGRGGFGKVRNSADSALSMT